MLTPIEFVQDLLNPHLAFLGRALIVATVCAVLCAVIGTHVVLRGLAFAGDAVTHAVFPGICVAFVLGGSLVAGGAVAGVLVAVGVALATRARRVGVQSVIGVFLTSAFAAGVVIMSFAPGYTGSLSSFLFGSITGVAADEVWATCALAAVLVAITLMLHRPLIAVSFEPETAAAQGVTRWAIDIALYVLVALAVVLSVRTIGNILVLALLITPAATARMWTRRVPTMMALAAGFGATAALVGLYLSWAVDMPTGATIVLVSTGFFALSLGLAPQHAARTQQRLVVSSATKS